MGKYFVDIHFGGRLGFYTNLCVKIDGIVYEMSFPDGKLQSQLHTYYVKPIELTEYMGFIANDEYYSDYRKNIYKYDIWCQIDL